MMKTKNILNNFKEMPWVMVVVITILSSVGFVMMYAAAYGSMEPWAMKQVYFFVVFFIVMIFIGLINIKTIYNFAYIAYGIALILLILVEVFGHNAMGATRWINLGLIKLQPSEIMKLTIVLALAKYFHNLSCYNVLKMKCLIIPALILFVPVLLIVKQPDLGTGMITLIVGVMMFFVAGVQIWKFVLAFILAIGSLPVLWHYLYDYQKQRILIFLDPERDPLGDGYNIIQSKIAIGSGGLFGKGMLAGSQAQLQFLPEHQTDFVLPMFAEEWGFIGIVIIMLLYILLMSYGTFIALHCKSQFGRLLAYGVTMVFSVHIFINMGMVMGLLPVVGVPLPFLSYGGTIMATILISFGLLINIQLNSKVNLSEVSLGMI